MHRREFLGLIASVTVAALMLPINALAALWNKPAFEALKLSDATKNLNINAELPSTDIEIIAPDRAENGAVVQIEITSKIPNTEAIAVFVEHNPTPLIANFMLSNGALPFVITRIKMAEDSDVKVVVKVGDKYYSNSKKVVVLENGCG
jgi:sulfur-oxidizing protein SoxY